MNVRITHLAVLAILASLAGCRNPVDPINSGVFGKNGRVSVVINNLIWVPDLVSTTATDSIEGSDSVITSHVQIHAWSDGYTITLSFAVPETLGVGRQGRFVINRSAPVEFTTPWPAQNDWKPAGDSTGVLTVTRVDDSTMSGRFNAKFESALATYWLSNGNFVTRVPSGN